MMAVDELTVVDEWLQSTLVGDATLTALLPDGANGVHDSEAPARAKYPLIIHQHQGSADVQEHAGITIMVSGLWLVKAVIEGRDYGALGPIVARAHLLLHRKTGTVGANGFVFSCTRTQPWRMPEHTDDGRDFRQAGAIYRILAQYA